MMNIPLSARKQPFLGSRTSLQPYQQKHQNLRHEESIQVAIRMRPLNAKERDHFSVWKVLSESSSVMQTTPEGYRLSDQTAGRNFFSFDKAFAETSSTQDVYNSVAKGVISSVLDGFNGTIFTYGQTSSGKTFTMQGSGTIREGSLSTGDKGIVHMAATDIFQHIHNTPRRNYQVHVSFLEVYNEEVRDLLSENNETVALREDPRHGVAAKSQKETVTEINDLLEVMFRGERSRKVAATAMNDRSSRSHTIFQITIESWKNVTDKTGNPSFDPNIENNQNGGTGEGKRFISTLNLVDLAGSESVKHTGATGDRQKEGSLINQSLLSLSRVIAALGKPNQTHINYRDSKLTRILQPSLSGNAKMAVICCVTPSQLYLEETRSTLQFATRAKLVKTRAHVNEAMDDQTVIRQLRQELAEAKRQINLAEVVRLRHSKQTKALEQKVVAAEAEAKKVKESLDRLRSLIIQNSLLYKKDAKDISKADERMTTNHCKQRRLSDGTAFLHQTKTPPKNIPSVANMSFTTIPRPFKKHHAKLTTHPSLSSEAAILKEALTDRNSKIAAMKEEMRNDSKIADLQSRIEEASSQQRAMVKEHSSTIVCTLQMLQEELHDRRAFEDTIRELHKELAMSTTKFDNEREMLLSDRNHAGRENARLARKNDEQDERIANLESKVLKLEGELRRGSELLFRSGWERDQLLIILNGQNEREGTCEALSRLNLTGLDMMMFPSLDTPKTNELMRMSMLSLDPPDNKHMTHGNGHVCVEDDASLEKKLPTRKRCASRDPDTPMQGIRTETKSESNCQKSSRGADSAFDFDIPVIDLTLEDDNTDNEAEPPDEFYENVDEFPVIPPEERLPVGTRVYKHFPPYGWFYGIIESLVEGNRLYFIKYTDGDEEILKHEDVLPILADNVCKKRETKVPRTRKKPSAKTKRQSKLPARKTRSSCRK